MLKTIIRFLTPIVVLGVALVGGWGLLTVLGNADKAFEASRKAARASAMQQEEAPATQVAPPATPYPWLAKYDPANTIGARIHAPPGYERVQVDPDTLSYWLRNLPLKPPGTPVRLWNGQEKPFQGGHVAVVDIDVGNEDLQQCADAIIRLKAEYLYSRRRYRDIHFNFTNGTNVEFVKWAEGIKPIVNGDVVTWTRPRRDRTRDYSYDNFRAYLETVMTYADTASLAQELAPVGSPKVMQISNIFIQAGHPGHAAMVVDMCENRRNGAKCFLLAQGFMPAQDIHILRNTRPADTRIWPWYDVNFGPTLKTPDWQFTRHDLKHFK
ncbi:MAG: DUF4846 domain-containing protein [Phycisphaerae bacterium]